MTTSMRISSRKNKKIRKNQKLKLVQPKKLEGNRKRIKIRKEREFQVPNIISSPFRVE